MNQSEGSLATTDLVPERGRITVYSCYFGQYEPFHRFALGPEGDWDNVVFTDHATLDAPGCRFVRLPEVLEGLTPKHLSRIMLAQDMRPVSGICHGTRRGHEQMWFRKHLGPQAEIVGTEISDTVTDFTHTNQWDFHEVDPVWVGAMDVVYSNSWGHAHDPKRAFAGWIGCLKPGGLLMPDHGWAYLPDHVSPIEPFGAFQTGLIKMLNRIGAGLGKVVEVINGGMHKRHQIRTVI